MNNQALSAFWQFTEFSPIGIRKDRERLVTGLFALLTGDKKKLPPFSHEDFRLWEQVLSAAFEGGGGFENGLTPDVSGLELSVLGEIINFMEDAENKFEKETNPYEYELQMINECKGAAINDFMGFWSGFKSHIELYYEKDKIDCSFYEKLFLESLCATNRKNLNADFVKINCNFRREEWSFGAVLEVFTEKWSAALKERILQWKKEFILQRARIFFKELEQKIMDFKSASHILGLSASSTQKIFNSARCVFTKSAVNALEKASDFYKNDGALQELSKSFGRSRKEIMQKKKVVKKQYGVELDGICLGGELSRVLPVETVFLTDEECSFIFYEKLIEKKLLNYKIKNIYTTASLDFKDENASGPFIICVDTSGSMKGVPETVAKSLCFALLKMALSGERKCYLISFAIDARAVELTDFERNADALTDFLSNSFYGGTDASYAFNMALEVLETEDYKNADVLVISDFIMPSLQEDALLKIKRFKENGVIFAQVLIGAVFSSNQQLDEVFDKKLYYSC
ncbi:MAG: VWA domain-containing protein [Spirochaetaceae bacterium]|jgi:uncharacterized protein with von Willebrand factor type A (vWA) domain|nr:VWA domain-containing protein [Spirochaetaceae bacterium]